MPPTRSTPAMDAETMTKLIRDVVRTEFTTFLKPIQTSLHRLETSLKDCVAKVEALEEAATWTDKRLDLLEKNYSLLKKRTRTTDNEDGNVGKPTYALLV